MTAPAIPRLDPVEAAAAYREIGPEIEAFPREALKPVTFDIPTATINAFATAVRIAPYREQIVQQLPRWDIRYFDRLTKYALAAWYAYLMQLPAVSASDIEELLARGMPLREKMLTWGEPLAKSGIFNAALFAQVKSGTGPKDAAGDMVTLAQMYREARDRIGTMTAVTTAEIDQAALIGAQLMAALGVRQGTDAGSANVQIDMKNRAANLFDLANDEVRRVLGYIRYHEGDVDELAPSAHAQPGSGRRATKPADGADPPIEPAATGTNPVNTGAPQTATATGTAAPAGPAVGSGGPFIK